MKSFNRRSGLPAPSLAALAVVLGFGSGAWAQSHGVSIGKSCLQDRCTGDTVDCSIQIGHNDGFGDSITILEAWDTMDPGGLNVRVPPAGNLPIAAVSGNTNCTVGGSLPCDICPAGSALCPGALDPGNQGFVIFQSNGYVIQPGDPNPLFNQASVRIRDNCNGCGSPPCPGCSSVPNLVGFGAATDILICEDNNACTENICTSGTAQAAGFCTFDPDCVMAGDCPEDKDPCTDTVCTPDGCCDYVPFCTMASECTDQFNCTVDSCVDGCCENICQTPGITCPDNQVYECDNVGEFGDPVVDDPCSMPQDVECTEQIIPGVNPQEYTVERTCTVTNDCGNTAQCMHTIEVVDTTPPEITCPADVDCECDDEKCDFGEPMVTDNCDPDPDVEVVVEQTVNDCTLRPRGISPPPKITITRTFTATDGASGTFRGGNPVVCEQTINIFDTNPPVIVNCPEPFSLCPGEDLDFTPPACSDTCGPCEVVCVRSDGQPLDSPVANPPITITCTAFDVCDNESAACDVEVSRSLDCGEDIPTVSEWGLAILALLLLIGGKVYFARPSPIVA